MGFLKKKADPISERARALSAQIAALESQIQLLSTQQDRALEQAQRHPRLRTTAIPHGPTVPTSTASTAPVLEPVFEDLDAQRLHGQQEAETPDHYNDLGVRKYDLPAAWRKFLKHFQGPPSSNPRLVNYLAAGSIQGLRPLRYEKRIARNRCLFFLVCLILALLGTLTAILRH